MWTPKNPKPNKNIKEIDQFMKNPAFFNFREFSRARKPFSGLTNGFPMIFDVSRSDLVGISVGESAWIKSSLFLKSFSILRTRLIFADAGPRACPRWAPPPRNRLGLTSCTTHAGPAHPKMIAETSSTCQTSIWADSLGLGGLLGPICDFCSFSGIPTDFHGNSGLV